MKIKDHFLSQETFELKETSTPGIYRTTPLPENLDKYYESPEYISHYQDAGSFKKKIYKFLQNFNLNYKRNIVAKETFQNARVLDYGCGAGGFLKFIEGDFETFGFEPNITAKNFAAKKLENTTLISNLDEIQNNSLNVITMWHVLEHIDNQAHILNKFHDKLKPNGLLIVAVPNYSSFDAQYYKEFWAAYDVPRHIYHFSKSGMEKLMNNYLWQIRKIRPLILDAFYISILSEKYRKNSLYWLVGSIIGTISNFKAIKTGEFSSLIYIIEKK